MTKGAYKRLVHFMYVAWPNKMANWPNDANAVWLSTLEGYHDVVVGYGVTLLMRDQTRDQQWPPTLSELVMYAERAEKEMRSQGWKP